jgi:hypothetical protein
MFIGNQLPVTPPQAIHLALEAERLALQHQAHDLTFVRRQLFMQAPSGIDGCIGNANLLHLFQIEEPLAIRERVQGHDADQGFGGALI